MRFATWTSMSSASVWTRKGMKLSVRWHYRLGDRKGNWLVILRFLCCLSPDILFQNKWRKKDKGKPAENDQQNVGSSWQLLPMRRCASAVSAMALCPFVTSLLCRNGWKDPVIFGTEASLRLSFTMLEGIRVSPKITVLHCGTLSQTLDFLQLHVDCRRCWPVLSNSVDA